MTTPAAPSSPEAILAAELAELKAKIEEAEERGSYPESHRLKLAMDGLSRRYASARSAHPDPAALEQINARLAEVKAEIAEREARGLFGQRTAELKSEMVNLAKRIPR